MRNLSLKRLAKLASRPPKPPHDPTDLAKRTRTAALYTLAGLTVVADLGAFAESANGVYHWGLLRGMTPWRAIFLPGFVDVFIAIGELGLFTLMFWGHRWWHRLGAWLVTLTGLAASVAANMGDVWGSPWATRITYAVPPVAAAAALYVGLSVLKRIIAVRRQQTEQTPAVAAVPQLAKDVPGAVALTGRRPFRPGTSRQPRPAVIPAGAEADLIEAAKADLMAGLTPVERQLARRYLGSDTRKRRAATLIGEARRQIEAGDRTWHQPEPTPNGQAHA